MDQYVKSIIIEPKIDKSKAKDIEEEIKKMTVRKFMSPEAVKEFDKITKDIKETSYKIGEAKKALKDIEGFKGPQFEKIKEELNEYLKSLGYEEPKEEGKETKVTSAWKTLFKELGSYAIKELDDVYTNVKDFLKDIYNDAKEMMLDIASFSSSSNVYSRERTSLGLSYGLTSKEAYARSRAVQDVGFSSFEDYLENFMFATDETNERLQNLLTKYSETYEQNEEIALAYQELQTEFEDFKTQLEMEVINFFTDNKDVIKAAFSYSIDFMHTMLDLVSFIVDRLGTGRDRTEMERASALSDIYNSYGATTNSNVKMDVTNNYNGVSSQDRAMIIDANNATYRQIIEALK